VFLVATGAAVGGACGAAGADAGLAAGGAVGSVACGAADGAAGEVAWLEAFTEALTVLCEDLARQIAFDGEGATKLVTINVAGAASTSDADLAARAVANSPLVKTAIAGHDANWGRIAMALGKSGAEFAQERVSFSIMGIPVCEAGLPVPFDEDEALRLFEQQTEIIININLGAGVAQTTIWTCDFTHEYISINGDYRS
jgi:glutamate N-acetyltransferase/amino-acid N-acetyltransferase